MQIVVIGLNHRTAPVEIRERLAFEAPELHPMLRHLDQEGYVREAVLLSTCNRTELYLRPGDALDEPEDAMRALCRDRDADFDTINPYLYEHEDLRAVEHAFEVAGSLNSMVLGESQILGQVKEAYDVAREGGFCGKFLHQMFQESFRVAKKIRSRTQINRLPTSVGSCAVALAGQIFDDLADQAVVVVGSGKMGRRCVEHLREEGVRSVRVANRTLERARELAETVNGEARTLDELDRLLTTADIVISSTGSREPILRRDRLEEVLDQRGRRPLFVIDIAVPRDVEDEVRQLDNVYLYDIDDLESVGQQNLGYREQELSRAHNLVQEGVRQFDEWLKTQDVGPMIRELKQDVYRLVEEELREHLEPSSSVSKSDLQLAAHRITNKLLDDPVNVMKEKVIEGERETLSTVREMFNLDAAP